MAQVRAVSDENEGALFLTLSASVVLLAWGAAMLIWLKRINHTISKPGAPAPGRSRTVGSLWAAQAE
jgi:hypothetical protein